jgi:hypothetical protein
MTSTEQHVWDCLHAFHRGRRQGVRTEDLARQLDLSRRHLRELVARLVRVHELPIGSHPTWGTYVVEDATDAALADQCLADEAFPTMDRRRALQRAWRRHRAVEEPKAEQLRMAL